MVRLAVCTTTPTADQIAWYRSGGPSVVVGRGRPETLLCAVCVRDARQAETQAAQQWVECYDEGHGRPYYFNQVVQPRSRA